MTQNLKRILLGTGLFLLLAAALPAQTRQETEAFKAAVEADLYGNILPFWSRFAPDTKDGFYGTILTDGTEGPLRPTQRFFNIRQLGMTPEHSFVIPASASKADINCVAYTKPATGECAVHVVNNAGACEAEISGFPAEAVTATVYTTNHRQNSEAARYPVKEGKVVIPLPASSFVTILTE